ncbi:hypothetical protein BC937DRAFT_90371 [Endogone sp. FLAS-F59071]|nr:hypothetical protein BC937DRAFT_90371 [Endogone sp. FLAS-F59071]|eukprot:RUS17144.1 hypothetical protein BC937DRAFT_90371 [Endogone sp. FLAS-F59071]
MALKDEWEDVGIGLAVAHDENIENGHVLVVNAAGISFVVRRIFSKNGNLSSIEQPILIQVSTAVDNTRKIEWRKRKESILSLASATPLKKLKKRKIVTFNSSHNKRIMEPAIPQPTTIDSASTTRFSTVCHQCHANLPKYKCPRCSMRTCSLECSKQHKVTTACSGERSKTHFVPMSKYGEQEMMNGK